MDFAELAVFAGAVAGGECDYAKANRLFMHGARDVIPRHRYFGNAILSFLTKIASGYWHVADPEAGYTAISLETLRLLDLERLYPRYGFENDKGYSVPEHFEALARLGPTIHHRRSFAPVAASSEELLAQAAQAVAAAPLPL